MDSLKSLGFDPGVLLINIFGFILLLWVFKRFLYGPISLFMGERTREIESQIAEARTLNAEAQQRHEGLHVELQQERDASREDIAHMVQEARTAIEEMRAEGRRQRQDIIEAGRQELDRSKDIALAQLTRDVSQLALQVSAKIIREALDDQRQQALVDDFLHDLEEAARQEGTS
jgi:F-type H+-transporting ATPase subunit b